MTAAVLLWLPSLAQEPQQPKPCVAADEQIYQLGIDGVKPPQPQPDKNAKGAPNIRGQFSLQLVVSSEGHVCSAKIVNASNRVAAEEGAKYIAQHWTFKPATKDGKPVAVTFRMNWTNFSPK